MRNLQLEGRIGNSLRRQFMTAFGVIFVLIGGIGGVAAYAEISGAIIGSGTVIVASRAKEVQHVDGGSIGGIFVHEGESVKAGEILFQIDGSSVRANLAIIISQLHQLLAQEARLMAEQGRLETIVFPTELEETDIASQRLRDAQVALMGARQATIEGKKSQLDEQVRQFREKIVALDAEQQAITTSMELLDEQIKDVSHLKKKGLIADSQVMIVKRERAALTANSASLRAEVAEAQQAIAEREIQKVQLDEEFFEAVLMELDVKRAEIAKLREERVAATDRLNRLDIRAPISGYVHQLDVHTIGRVASPGETLLMIIPVDDELLVEARLSPIDVDQIHKGQIARVRLTGLDQRVTPQLQGEVLSISPDLTTDDKTGMSYYTARIGLSDDELSRLNDQALRPGMPVEVFVETNTRTVLSYLAKPLRDQIHHAMREN